MPRNPIFLMIFILSFGFRLNYAEDFFRVRESIRDNSRFRLGFLYITPLLSLENVGYSSNIYRYDEIVEPDWTADLGVDLKLAVLVGKRFILVLKDNPYYSFYLENKSEEAWNNKLQFAVYSFLGPFNFKFTLDRDDLKQLPTAEFGIRVRHRISREKLSLDYGNHQRFYLNLYGEQSRMSYQDEDYLGEVDLGQLLDQKQYQVGLNINKVIFSRTVIFINLEYFRYRFFNYADRDGEGELVNLGLIFPEIGNITGSFRLGYRFSRPDNPLYAPYSSPYGSGEIKMRLWRRIRFSVEYMVDNSFSFYQPDNYYNQRTITGGIELYFTRNFKLGYRHQYGQLLFKNLESGDIERKDRIYQSRFFTGIRIFRIMGIGIEYSQFRTESDVLDYSRSYDFIGGYISYDF